MRKGYIRKVKRLLPLTGKRKSAVIGDLSEIFDIAAENGETEQDVINRIGSPEEYVNDVCEGFGISNLNRKVFEWIKILSITIAILVAAAVIFGVIDYCDSRIIIPEDEIILAHTSVTVSVPLKNGFNLLQHPFLLLSLLAVIVTIILAFTVLLIRKTMKRSEEKHNEKIN